MKSIWIGIQHGTLKHRVKRSIKVPAISYKLADIPPDDYSWRKYRQRPIKGSPHPRGYYKFKFPNDRIWNFILLDPFSSSTI